MNRILPQIDSDIRLQVTTTYSIQTSSLSVQLLFHNTSNLL